jgi:hypothetical protein
MPALAKSLHGGRIFTLVVDIDLVGRFVKWESAAFLLLLSNHLNCVCAYISILLSPQSQHYPPPTRWGMFGGNLGSTATLRGR